MLSLFVNSIRSSYIFSRPSNIIRNLLSMSKYWRRMSRCMPCWQFASHFVPKWSLLRRLWIPNCERNMVKRWSECRDMTMRHLLFMMSSSHMRVLSLSPPLLQVTRSLLWITIRYNSHPMSFRRVWTWDQNLSSLIHCHWQVFTKKKSFFCPSDLDFASSHSLSFQSTTLQFVDK